MEALRTVLFSFKLADPDAGVAAVQTVLGKHFPSLKQNQRVCLGSSNGFLVVFSAENGAAITFTLRYYQSEQLFTLNGECSKACAEFSLMNNPKLEGLKEELEKATSLQSVERLPVLKRNSSVPQYFLSSDSRALEYDFDKVLVHQKSQFQDIKILHSPTFGNALLLDDLQNLAEGDLNYTRGLMKYGINSYKDKEILILGGGDGGLLHELLKEGPKFVTMVDIDGAVMEACKVHLRGACGSDLDSFTGSNYEVIVGDCLVYMKQYIEQNKTFDYVFNDLTDIPISTDDSKDAITDNSPELWNFVKQILEMGLQLVRKDGSYLNHAIGVGCTSALKEYEKVLDQLPVKVQYTSHTAFVPSFIEEWVFYEIRKA